MGYTIRLADTTDCDWIVRVGREFADATVARCSDDVLMKMFDDCMNRGLVVVAEGVGFIAGYFVEVPLLGGLVFHEVAWYVDKKHRGCGVALFDEMERLAKEAGCVAILMIAYGNEYQRLVEAIYKRRGYKDMEHHWMRRL